MSKCQLNAVAYNHFRFYYSEGAKLFFNDFCVLCWHVVMLLYICIYILLDTEKAIHLQQGQFSVSVSL